jgi:hypothetical protein
MSVEFITWVHREFCERLPDDLLGSNTPTPKSGYGSYRASCAKTMLRSASTFLRRRTVLTSFLQRLTEV